MAQLSRIILTAIVFGTFVYGVYIYSPKQEIDYGFKNEVRILEWDWVDSGFGTRRIVGYAQNQTDRALEYAEINFSFYDVNGELVGVHPTRQEAIPPKDVWKFELVVVYKDAVDAKVKHVSTY